MNLEAGQENPAKVGKDLAPTGINLLQFCKQYTGQFIPAAITVYEDRTFDVKLKTPLTSYLLKKYAGIAKGATQPGSETVGSITQEQLRKIAEMKLPDLNTARVDRAMSMIAGTARSMGIRIKQD